MSWQITIIDDPDTTGEQTVIATFVDPVYGVFTFTRRIKTIYARYVGFVAQAKASLTVWQVRQMQLTEIKDWIIEMITT